MAWLLHRRRVYGTAVAMETRICNAYHAPGIFTLHANANFEKSILRFSQTNNCFSDSLILCFNLLLTSVNLQLFCIRCILSVKYI